MAKRTRKQNGEGSTYPVYNKKGELIRYECIIQTKIINPKTLKHLRIKGSGKTEQLAQEDAKKKVRFEKKKLERQLNNRYNSTFGEYTRERMNAKNNIKKNTVKDYTYKLEQFFYPSNFSKLQVAQLTYTDFENFYNEIYEKSYGAAKTIQSILNKVIDDAIILGYLDQNYSRQYEYNAKKKDEIQKTRDYTNKKSDKKHLSNEELMIVYDYYQKYRYTHKYPAVYILMIETSIRGGELCGLRIYDFDEENRLLHINSQIQYQLNDDESIRWNYNKDKIKKITTYETVLKEQNSSQNKNNEHYEKIIYLHDLAFEACKILKEKALAQYYDGKNEKEYLVPNQNGDALDVGTFRVSFHNDMKKMGIETPRGFGPHKAFRHTGITFANANCSTSNLLANLQKSGHSSIKMEEYYTHRDSIDIMKSINTPFQELLKAQKEEENVTISKDEYNELLDFVRKYKESQQS